MGTVEPLKPDTLADLKRYVLQTKGVIVAMHLESVESKCTCEICACIRIAIANENAPTG